MHVSNTGERHALTIRQPLNRSCGADRTLRLPGAPEKYRANNASTVGRLREPPLSILWGFFRLWRHMPECGKQVQLSSPTYALPPEVLPSHRQGLPSSIRSVQAGKPLQLRPSPLLLTPFTPFTLMPQPDCRLFGTQLMPSYCRGLRAGDCGSPPIQCRRRFRARRSEWLLLDRADRHDFLVPSCTAKGHLGWRARSVSWKSGSRALARATGPFRPLARLV